MDNHLFASHSQQPLLPKTVHHSATKTADKNNGGQALNLLAIALKTGSNKPMHSAILWNTGYTALYINSPT